MIPVVYSRAWFGTCCILKFITLWMNEWTCKILKINGFQNREINAAIHKCNRLFYKFVKGMWM